MNHSSKAEVKYLEVRCAKWFGTAEAGKNWNPNKVKIQRYQLLSMVKLLNLAWSEQK